MFDAFGGRKSFQYDLILELAVLGDDTQWHSDNWHGCISWSSYCDLTQRHFKIQVIITMDHQLPFRIFWLGGVVMTDLIRYFGDELFIINLINWLIGDFWLSTKFRCFREGVWHLPGSPSGLAACVSDERYGTSGSYYSWEGEVRVGWVFGEKFKFLKSWKLMIFYVFFHLYVPQWILGCKYQLRMYRFDFCWNEAVKIKMMDFHFGLVGTGMQLHGLIRISGFLPTFPSFYLSCSMK